MTEARSFFALPREAKREEILKAAGYTVVSDSEYREVAGKLVACSTADDRFHVDGREIY